jgi:hypothetical protein
LAFLYHRLEVAKELIVSGSKVDEKDNNGRTPLSLLEQDKREEIENFIEEMNLTKPAL